MRYILTMSFRKFRKASLQSVSQKEYFGTQELLDGEEGLAGYNVDVVKKLIGGLGIDRKEKEGINTCVVEFGAGTGSLAEIWRSETGLDVVESSDQMELKPGMIVIVKGGTDAVVREPFPGKLMLYQKTDQLANIHPNADVLFRSAASASCPVVAVVMTGMGSDGMLGAKDLVARKNAHVLVQDPDSCIVDGMPASTIRAGLASAVLVPKDIGLRLSRLCASRTISSLKTSAI